jgi:ATP-binding cassette subfamily B protein
VLIVIIPLIVWGLVQGLPENPGLRLGVMMVLLLPCTDWFISFTHLGRGDTALAVAFTPLSLLLQMALLPAYLVVFLGHAELVGLFQRELLLAFGGLILLLDTTAKLASILLLGFPLVIVPILIYGRRVRSLSRLSQDRVAEVGSYVGENLTQIKTVQAFNHQPHDRAFFSTVAENAFDIARTRIRQRAWLTTIAITLVMGAVGVVLWIGGLDVISGQTSPGELAAFVFYSLLVGLAAGAISEVIGELQRAAGAAARIFELLQTESELPPVPESVEPLRRPVEGSLDIRGLSFRYPSRPDLKVLDRLSVTIKAGETIALVGPSGAGKSTLFDLLLRFYDPDEGQILLDGADTRRLALSDLRRCFALVPQSPALFHGTIADNIRYARPDASDEDMIAAARTAHAHEFIQGFPEGYETRLGDGGIGLSGGQKQRLAISRALLANAPIMLLDEATSALDAQSEYLIQQAMPGLMSDRTTLVIAHRLATVRHADRIMVLDKGRLQDIGRHDELVARNPLYRKLARLQFRENQ